VVWLVLGVTATEAAICVRFVWLISGAIRLLERLFVCGMADPWGYGY